MDVPSIPKSRPQRQKESVKPAEEADETPVPSIPCHRPQKVEAELPQLPKTRPRKIQTTDPAVESGTSSPIKSETSTPLIPSHRPRVEAEVKTEEDESEILAETPSIPSSRPSRSSQSVVSGETSDAPSIPSSRPKKVVTQTEVEEPEIKEEETQAIEAAVKDDSKSIKDEIVSSIHSIVKPISDEKVTEESEAGKKDAVTEAEVTHGNEESVEVEVEEEPEIKVTSDEPEIKESAVSSTGVKQEESATVDDRKSISDNEIAHVDAENKSSRKSSHSSAKKALDDLDTLEQEIELTSENISSLPTDDAEIEAPVAETATEKETTAESVEESKEKIIDEVKEEIKKEEETIPESDLPVIPKSRPRPKAVEDTESKSSSTEDITEEAYNHQAPPKVPVKRPSVNSTESTASAEAAHKKPPPRVPKKPSSRIAQFQEMLQQQQQADLGLLETPKPKPKIPVKHYDITPEGVSEGKEVEVTESKDVPTDESAAPVQKVDRVHSKFAQSLNGMIGVGLPGMAFGGNPYAAIKAAKATQAQENEEEYGESKPEEEGDSEKKVKDVRRGRTRGPRGRKLPDSVSKSVEINDSTLGNTFSIVVNDSWSFDFNQPKSAEAEAEVEKKEIDEPESESAIEPVEDAKTETEKEVTVEEIETKEPVEEDVEEIAETKESVDDTKPTETETAEEEFHEAEEDVEMPATTFNAGTEEESVKEPEEATTESKTADEVAGTATTELAKLESGGDSDSDA